MEKIIDIEERIPSLRQRRKRRMTFTFSILLFLFFSALFLILYLQSSWSKIQSIEVKGVHVLKQDEIIALSDLHTGDSIWGFRIGSIEEQIATHESIESVKVSRENFRDVVIKINEFDVIGYAFEDDHLVILSNGTQVKTVESGSMLGPALHEFSNEKARERLIKELASLDVRDRSLISEISSTPSDSDPYLVTVYMNDGNTVIASAMSFAENVRYYTDILEQIPAGQKGIIDMEIGVFFESYESVYGGKGEEMNLEEEEVTE